jgi:hypothetical protein
MKRKRKGKSIARKIYIKKKTEDHVDCSTSPSLVGAHNHKAPSKSKNDTKKTSRFRRKTAQERHGMCKRDVEQRASPAD